MNEDLNRTPTMDEAGYSFVKYLNICKTKAIFQIENDREIWLVGTQPERYGFYFDNKYWCFDKQIG